jgi:protein gp37
VSAQTKIQWCDDTWNPWIGCVKVSTGCKNCYAETSTPVRVARSEGRELWGGKLRDKAKDFKAPLRWNERPWVCDTCGTARELGALCAGHDSSIKLGKCTKCNDFGSSFHRRRVFSLSLGDWLDPDVPIEWLAEMLDVIRRCPNLDLLLLTKRPEQWSIRLLHAAMWAAGFRDGQTGGQPTAEAHPAYEFISDWIMNGKPPANVWIGTTVENQEMADKRIPELLKIPAVCRFISYEPALGPVDFSFDFYSDWACRECGSRNVNTEVQVGPDDVGTYQCHDCKYMGEGEDAAWKSQIDWVIVGGESGNKAREFSINWARATVHQCKESKIPCFVKQLGADPRHDYEGVAVFTGPIEGETKVQIKNGPLRLKDKKGGDMSEWPEELRVRQFPSVNAPTPH